MRTRNCFNNASRSPMSHGLKWTTTGACCCCCSKACIIERVDVLPLPQAPSIDRTKPPIALPRATALAAASANPRRPSLSCPNAQLARIFREHGSCSILEQLAHFAASAGAGGRAGSSIFCRAGVPPPYPHCLSTCRGQHSAASTEPGHALQPGTRASSGEQRPATGESSWYCAPRPRRSSAASAESCRRRRAPARFPSGQCGAG